MRPVLFAVALVIAVLTIVYLSQPRVGEVPQTSKAFSTRMQSQLSKLRQTVQNSREHILRIMITRVSYPVSSKSIWKNSELSFEIPVVIHGNGRATANSTNQWSTVMMMVIDEDGTRRMVERQSSRWNFGNPEK